MKLYSALIKKDSHNKIADMVFLKDSFCWMAFLFSGLWFLYHKMWKELVVLLLANYTINSLVEFNFISDLDQILLGSVLMLMIGFNANEWRAENLKKKGYNFSGLVFGSDCINAKIRFVKDLNNFDIDEFDEKYIMVGQGFSAKARI